MKKVNDDKTDELIGKRIAEVLGLIPSEDYNTEGNIRFETTWGTKTYIGLARMAQSILEEKYEGN
jgi:hypothetical protein